MNRRVLAVVLVLGLALAVTACDRGPRVTYIPDGGDYALEDLERLLDGTELGDAAEIATEDAVDDRQEALASLRREGDAPSALADTLTRDFPIDHAAVPVLVERATYDGADVWVVVEAWGDPGGALQHRQLWVLAADGGQILVSLRGD